ncbi:peptidoglycan DD-metalloendopeptidase family protein [Streptomyces aureoversilis]|uniref:Peptidoglycan DD-metalloendopeptidase family protein n=1 Tax=Streptomyces aureoversilis TaxID=67277 RepID=A0ABW0ABE2_9ACTN
MKKLFLSVGCAGIALFGVLVAAVLAVTSAIGNDNTSDSMTNAGFGGGLANTKDIPDWVRPLITGAVQKYGCPEVTPSLIAAQIYSESSFDPKAQSFHVETDPKTGEKHKIPIADGIAQFIPETWATEGVDGDGDGVKDVWNPKDAIPAAVSYDCHLAKDVKNVPGDKTDNMLAAYNAGPYAVIKAGGVPAIEETQGYVKEIRALARKWAAPMTGRPGASGRLGDVVQAARSALDTLYVWGGDCQPPFEGANGCDCSSLVKMAWSKAGVNLARSTYDQVREGSEVRSVGDLRPGDLIFTGGSASAPEHVSMYIGGGEVIDAPHTDARVRIKPLSYWESQILTIRRPAYTEPASGGSGSWGTPVSDDSIGTGYHVPGSMWSSGYHTGIDFPVSTGTTIHAVGPGTVVTAGWNSAYGNQVVIRHDDGKYSQYAHMSSLSVSDGQQVGGGQQIGISGATGNVSGPHLHFEIRTGPEYGSDIDPVGYLRGHGVNL